MLTDDVLTRYYFALRPAADLRKKLMRVADSLTLQSGVVLPPDQLHITLAHVGDVRAPRLVDLRRAAAELAFERVELELTRIEYWPEVKLAALVCDRRPEGLLRFVRTLHTALKRLGVIHHDFEYHPHVTLAEEVNEDVSLALSRPIYWRADHFVLVEARSDIYGAVEHRVVDAWEGGWAAEVAVDL